MATNEDGKKEPQIFSCHRRDQIGHYIMIELATQEFLMFQCLDWLAKILFIEQR